VCAPRAIDYSYDLNLFKAHAARCATRSPTGDVVKVGFGSTPAGSWRQNERPLTAPRMRAKLREIKETLKRHDDKPLHEQGESLASVLRGYFAYFAVPTNTPSLDAFRHHVDESTHLGPRQIVALTAAPERLEPAHLVLRISI
jgi:hypothetical protein